MNVIIPVTASLVFAIILIVVIRYFIKEKQKKLTDNISAELAVEGGRLLVQPERGSFRGATQKYGKIKCDGVIYLTTEKIVFHPLVGKNIIKINLFEIQNITIEKAFLGNWVAGMKVMVLHLTDSTQVGFCVREHDEWKLKIENAKTS